MKKIFSFFLSLILLIGVNGNTFMVKAVAQPEAPIIRNSLSQKIAGLKDEDRISVIIRYKDKIDQDRLNNLKKEGILKREFSVLLNGVEVELPVRVVKLLTGSDLLISHIEENLPVKMTLDTSTTQIESKKVQDELHLTGKGIKVAVLDTGVFGAQPALTGKLIKEKDFTGEGGGDGNGHGTHVAGIIASIDKTYRGNAPGAMILSAKVLNKEGSGDLSTVISALEWAYSEGADVVNLSLGALITDCDGTDAASAAVDAIVKKGVVAVVAAGNNGPLAGTINSPGCAAEAITVGSVNDYDKVSYFSSRGPTSDNRKKPEILAPGENITSSWYDGTFHTIGGTSQATPHIAGVVALLKEAKADLTPAQIKTVLIETADPLSRSFLNMQNQGVVNAYKAVTKYTTTPKPEEPNNNQPVEQPTTPEQPKNNTPEDLKKMLPATAEVTLEQAREELKTCLAEAGTDEQKKAKCMEDFLQTQKNIQYKKFSSVEQESIDSLYQKTIDLYNKLKPEDQVVFKPAIENILKYLFAGSSATQLEQKMTEITAKVDKSESINGEETKLKKLTDKEIAESETEKYSRSLIPFQDTDDNVWFFSYIADIKTKGCVSGYKDEKGNLTGFYGPENKITVAEAMRVVLECSGQMDEEKNAGSGTSGMTGSSGLTGSTGLTGTSGLTVSEPITTKAKNHWAKDYYIEAESIGLSIASNPNEDPNRPITRAEFMQLILETYEKTPLTEFETIFSDVAKDNAYAKWIYTAYSLKIIAGDANANTFRPNDSINRAEAAKVMVEAGKAL